MKMNWESLGFLLALLVAIFLSSTDANSVTFTPMNITIHENHNALYDLTTVTAECTVACNDCEITSNPSDHFIMNGTVIQKKTCSDEYCSNCITAGCLTGPAEYIVNVTCKNNAYPGSVSNTFVVTVSEANPPTFEFSNGNSINVTHDNMGVGYVINTIVVTNLKDNANDDDHASYNSSIVPESSYEIGTKDLFSLDTTTDPDIIEIKVNKDLTKEYSYTYTMTVCVSDRRKRGGCKTLTIKLWACFEKPNCENQSELDLHDTYGTFTNGHGGDSNTIFVMNYGPPTGHFASDFSAVWHNLTWSLVDNDNKLPEAEINVTTGEIYITSNISIWPAWPTKDFRLIVQVSNSESCEPTTCSFDIRVHYTNWPIRICSSLNSSLHEDTDDEIAIFNLTTYDYNNPKEDNVTCTIQSLTPNETNLFELRSDGNYAYDSYTVYKLECSTRNCGFKYQEPTPYYCDTNTGCLTHNRTQQYTISIECKDAYNSSDTQNFTFHVLKNEAPVYRDLPTHIDLNRQSVSHLDTIFEIIYSDKENDSLKYEYVYTDIETNLNTTYFLGDSNGNTHNSMANITMTTFLWDKVVNKTYKIQICGHERRNEICEDLTIDIEEYCSESPQCSDSNCVTDTEFPNGGELFDIQQLVNGGTFSNLRYDITSKHGNLFAVDPVTGKVTTTAKFGEIFDSANYSITALVSNSGSCSHGQCQLTVTVIAINYAVNITNLPATVNVSEDLATESIVFVVDVQDENDNDPFTCEIVNAASVLPFYLERIPPISGVYVIKNQEEGVLSSATTTYSVSIECTDSHGGNDTDVLTIHVTLNQAPTFTNFTNETKSISADPMNYKVGDTLYTVDATDNEGDDLIFTCTIPNSQVPYKCESEATSVNLKIRRDLRLDDDNGQMYSVQICLRDAKHSNQCRHLEVTFTREKTRPEITNLPDSKSFTEDTAVGTTIFEAVISDPDVNETHIYSVVVEPASETSRFSFDTSNGILTLQQSLDYERVNSYLFTLTVRDEYLEGLAEKTLKVAVSNVNEGTSISAETTTISFYENIGANTVLSDPGLSCSDTDGDVTSYEILTGVQKDYFSINSRSGLITLVKVWDLESADGLPTSSVLTIGCKDPGGLSSTVDITVHIEDANDKSPILTVVTGSSPISINQSTCLCTDLMSFAASDSDFSDDNDFEFSLLGSGIGFKYFRMVKTGPSTANLRLKAMPGFKNDKTFSISVKVSDNEPHPLFHGITLEFNYTVGDPDDSKAKEGARCLTCTRVGRTLIVVTAIEGVIAILFVLHIIYACVLSKPKKWKRVHPSTSKNAMSSTVKKSLGHARTRVKAEDAVKMNRFRNNKDKTNHEESDSGTGSSESDSDDDDRMRPHHNRHMSIRGRNGSQATQPDEVPPPLFRTRTMSAGQRSLASISGIEPAFYV
ncbi:uncharacterized protein LOC132747251 [Ruditapes philippinarum]|uniref:uncharacterized protein LOC132747251 n=1 Tax=Ruditapes philippinarum TaxID=129788 RepID=UPI00295B2AFD|nr:uncharacterized protein LOC132747251 [Ruditapes philippinarum]